MKAKKHTVYNDRDERGRFLKGAAKGRPKGAKSHDLRQLFNAVLRTFELRAGVRRLSIWAKKHPTALYRDLLPKVFPAQVMQQILLKTMEKEKIKGMPKIVFKAAEAPRLRARIAQLEKLSEDHKIALPEPEEGSLALPEYNEKMRDMDSERTLKEGEKKY